MKISCSDADNPQSSQVHVGIVGAGIGGLAAAIAMCHAGAQVTVLEAAEELGEVCIEPSIRRFLR